MDHTSNPQLCQRAEQRPPFPQHSTQPHDPVSDLVRKYGHTTTRSHLPNRDAQLSTPQSLHPANTNLSPIASRHKQSRHSEPQTTHTMFLQRQLQQQLVSAVSMSPPGGQHATQQQQHQTHYHDYQQNQQQQQQHHHQHQQIFSLLATAQSQAQFQTPVSKTTPFVSDRHQPEPPLGVNCDTSLRIILALQTLATTTEPDNKQPKQLQQTQQQHPQLQHQHQQQHWQRQQKITTDSRSVEPPQELPQLPTSFDTTYLTSSMTTPSLANKSTPSPPAVSALSAVTRGTPQKLLSLFEDSSIRVSTPLKGRKKRKEPEPSALTFLGDESMIIAANFTQREATNAILDEVQDILVARSPDSDSEFCQASYSVFPAVSASTSEITEVSQQPQQMENITTVNDTTNKQPISFLTDSEAARRRRNECVRSCRERKKQQAYDLEAQAQTLAREVAEKMELVKRLREGNHALLLQTNLMKAKLEFKQKLQEAVTAASESTYSDSSQLSSPVHQHQHQHRRGAVCVDAGVGGSPPQNDSAVGDR
eukprot:c12907_g1_i2.p1 GENE.c12907_g1_i2~~c12907_g1_i2.p1  ORF type:complete len:535 (-),score=115.28 c12907_g1_i2:262-1866(-)